MNTSRPALEGFYAKYNRREYVHPDPLEFLYRYEDTGDREIAGLVASSLAYGRVRQILKSVAAVLEEIPGPSEFLKRATARTLKRRFRGFKHRFTTGAELAGLLNGAKLVVAEYGSLGACFAEGLEPEAETILPALCRFAGALRGDRGFNSLLSCPEKGSACKRLCLFLRWMVRKDEVDPGGWQYVPASGLIVPLDTHMHRIARALGFTRRKQADMCTSLEVTRAFCRIAPEDPVKYDFALTRLGIRADIRREGLGPLLRSVEAG